MSLNERKAREIIERGILITADKNLTVKDLGDHFTAKGYLLAIEQMRPFILAFEALATGACEKKGCSVVARYVLAQWNEGKK